jgi:phage tail-like protein
MMAIPKFNPFPASNFQVEVDGVIAGSFSEVSGIGAEIDIEEYREGGVNDFVHKLLKNTKQENLTLKRPLTKLTVLYDWYKQVVMGNIERRTLVDSQEGLIKSWSYKDCIPVSWKGPELKSDGNTMGIESVTLVHRGLVW